MLKNLLFVAVATILFSANAAAQTSEFDSRLLVKFSQEELKQMPAEDLNYWTFFVQDGFVIFEISKEKGESEMEKIAFDGIPSEANPLGLGLLPKETEMQTYRLGNSGFGIMVLSEKKLRAKMERLNK